MSDKLKVGQIFLENKRPFREIHILSIFQDLNGKNKIAIQKRYPPREVLSGISIKQPTEQAKVVTPAYFYGLTVKI